MSKIPFPDLASVDSRQRAIFERLPKINLFQFALHLDKGFESFVRFSGSMLVYSEVDPVLREIAILRVGGISKSEYEFAQHANLARQIGISEDIINLLKNNAPPSDFEGDYQAIVQFTDEIVHNVKPTDDSMNRVMGILNNRSLVELVFAIGFYMMVARVLETFEVDLDEDLPTTRIDRP